MKDITYLYISKTTVNASHTETQVKIFPKNKTSRCNEIIAANLLTTRVKYQTPATKISPHFQEASLF